MDSIQYGNNFRLHKSAIPEKEVTKNVENFQELVCEATSEVNLIADQLIDTNIRTVSQAAFQRIFEENNLLNEELKKKKMECRYLRKMCCKKDKKIKELKLKLKTEREKLQNGKRKAEYEIIENKRIMKKRKLNGSRYTLKVRSMAVDIYFASPKSYRRLRAKHLTLPHPSTVRRWINKETLKSGFDHRILGILASKVKNLDEKEKCCSIMIDGMSIKENLNYDAKKDQFFGLPDNFNETGMENNNPEILANCALTVMIGGLQSGYKQVW